MPLATDWDNKILQITSPTTSVDGQALHDFIEDQMASPEGLLYADILTPEGKIEDPTNPGVFSQIIIVLSSLWQIQFWQGSGYSRIYGAKIVGGVSDQPMKATGFAGDITVLESPVDGVTVVSGSGITEQDKTDIIDGTWEKSAATVIEGSYGQAARREAFGGAVWVDKNSGSPGTSFPLGTAAKPSSNMSDATAIGLAENIRHIKVAEDITIGATDVVDGFTIEASHASKSDITVIPGASTKFTQFLNCVLTGTLNGWVVVRDSVAEDLIDFQGILHQTVINGRVQLTGTQTIHILSCFSGVAGQETPEIGWNGSNAPLGVRDYVGGAKFVDKAGDSAVSVDMSSGQVLLDGTIVNGTFVLRGQGVLTENSSTGTTVYNHLSNPTSTAAAVWNALTASYQAADSFGKLVKGKLTKILQIMG